MRGSSDEAFLDKTLAVFQPRTSRRLTREDARQITLNAAGFFRVLLEWDAAARAAVSHSPASTDLPNAIPAEGGRVSAPQSLEV